MNFSDKVKEKLLSIIDEMDLHHWRFTKCPEKDFSGKKKWSFKEMIRFMLCMESRTVKEELLKYFDHDINTPTNSSFNQRRSQILPEAFEFLFNEFTNSFPSKNALYNGFRLLACDGSDICIAHNPNDETTYFQSTPKSKGFNMLHLNALYDLSTRTYVDAVIQPRHKENECKAMCEMVDRYHENVKTIFISDRGYENYNIFAHVEQKGMFYLIRVKDIDSNGITSACDLPKTPEFDKWISLNLTKKQDKFVKANLKKYRVVKKNRTFDFLDLDSNKFYHINMRIVRFPISDDTYECIITNLPKDMFSAEEIKKLYHMRWDIETSFRELKYAVGLTKFHSKKVEYIKQEIWARMTLYNFCEIITTKAVVENKENNKHIYKVNYTRAIYICTHFLLIKKEKAPSNVEDLIKKELLPERKGRSSPRKVKPQSAKSFLYR